MPAHCWSMRSRYAAATLGVGLGRVVLEDHGGDRRHRRQVVAWCSFFTFGASAPRITSHMMTSEPSMPPFSAYSAIVMLGELLRILLQQVEELHVPGRVVEAGALAVHLVRESAGADDRDLDVLGDSSRSPCAARWPSLKQRRADGIGNCSTPTCSGTIAPGHSVLVRPQQRQRREAAVVERPSPGRTTGRTRRRRGRWPCAAPAPGDP